MVAGPKRFVREPVRLAFAVLISGALAVSCALVPGYTSPSGMAAENLSIADGYAELGKHEKAADYYRKASRFPRYRNAADWGLARSLSLSGKWEDALPVLERLYGQEKGNRLISEAYAYALVASGRQDDGLEAYRVIYEREPDSPDAAVNYVEAIALAERWESVLSVSGDVRAAFPENENLHRLDALEEKARAALAPEGEADGAPLNETGESPGEIGQPSAETGEAAVESSDSPGVTDPSTGEGL